MTFNELNSVEYFFIERLTGINLNKIESGNVVRMPTANYGTFHWKYVQSEVLKRDITDVLLENELKESLCRLNPNIKANPDYVDEVIHKLRAILITVSNVGLVRANEEFVRWLRNEMSMPIGPKGEHVNIKMIDFENTGNNRYIITNQLKVHAHSGAV